MAPRRLGLGGGGGAAPALTLHHLHHHRHDVLVTGISALRAEKAFQEEAPGRLPFSHGSLCGIGQKYPPPRRTHPQAVRGGASGKPAGSGDSQPLRGQPRPQRDFLPGDSPLLGADSPPRPVSPAVPARLGLQLVLEGRGARGSPAPPGCPHPRWGPGSRVLRGLLAAGVGVGVVRSGGESSHAPGRERGKGGESGGWEEEGVDREEKGRGRCGRRGRRPGQQPSPGSGARHRGGWTHLSLGPRLSRLALQAQGSRVTGAEAPEPAPLSPPPHPRPGRPRAASSPSRLSLPGDRPPPGRPAN